MKKIDVLIVGAGISGIGAACHIKQNCPDRTFAVLETRQAIGGTWDFFRYPGIRSDSDMYTMGYSFKPWVDDKALADGESIRDYICEAATENNIDQHLLTGHRVQAAHWHSGQACWHVEVLVLATNEVVQYQCEFLYLCTGYYDYDNPYMPEFKGSENFNGELVHPQHWSADLDYSNKKVVVIGSGATAVTLVPAMAKKAAHVTMLQRTPSYILSVDEVDSVSAFLRRYVPDKLTYAITRWKNILMGMLVYQVCTRKPSWAKAVVRKGLIKLLGEQYDIDKHFSPSYDPWDQRLCMVPDGDLFHAINEGKASVVTDHIDRFVENGIQLNSGEVLEADIVVTATGLKLLTGGSANFEVDGQKIDFGNSINYKGVMMSGVPNLGMTFGYTNSSWTLKADLTSEYICRLLNHMESNGFDFAVPTLPADGSVQPEPLLDFSSGYVQRAIADLPKQGQEKPWRLNQNYALDTINLRHRTVADDTLVFGKAKVQAKTRDLEAA